MTRAHKRLSLGSGGSGVSGFDPFMLVALAVSVALLVILGLDKSADTYTSYRGPFLEVWGTQYDELGSYEELHDSQLLGTYPHEFRFGLAGGNADAAGNAVPDTFAYRFFGKNDAARPYAASFRSQATITLSGMYGNELEYRIEPSVPEEKGVWTAYANIPKGVNLDNPVGTWRLRVMSTTGKWKHTTWLTIRGDGTGEFGSLDNDSEKANESELAAATRPCTVTCERTAWGARAVASYEGGTYVLTIAERSMDDVLAASV